MKILMLAPQWPDPPRQGAAIRNLHILLYLAQRHRVTLFTFLPNEPVERARLEAVCEHAEALPMPIRSAFQRLKTLLTSFLPDMAWRLHSDAMRERITTLCRQAQFDAVHVEGIEMVPYGSLAQQIQIPKSKIQNTYDAHNAEYLLQRRASTTDLADLRRWPRALYSLVQWWRLRRFERQVCLLSDHVLSVSEADKVALSRLSHGLEKRITVLPNGVDPEYWSRDADFPNADVPISGEVLVFDGSMDFRPNVDAVLWFVGEVWPLIRAERPEARFFVVGRNPTSAVRALGGVPGVKVTGAVDDTRPWVAAATVYVVPMRMGGGVRLKVLQAMAMGCAIISTPMGAEGISVEDGKHLLLARSARDFAQATLSLLADAPGRVSLGAAARELAAQSYAWGKLLPRLDEIYPG